MPLPLRLSAALPNLRPTLSPKPVQGWRATRARAGQLATRVRLAFASGRQRRGASGGGQGGAGSGGGGTGTAYRPLGSGRRRGSGAIQEEDEATSEGAPSLPSRLREVLVAGSFGSSFADVEGPSPPASARAPLLATRSSSGLTSPRSPAERSPGK